MEERLRAALRAAMRERDPVATAALRSALGALGNATAVPAPPPAATGDEHFAGSAVGVGAAEASRHVLTPAESAAVVRAEIEERLAAASGYGPGPAADRLRAEAAVLAAYLD
ncbi:MAG TPA: hypothetical protein VLM05_01550 [Mycobacteriales bacterium]|nr:hypothetical protein [Mycobacteriales bacterium]